MEVQEARWVILTASLVVVLLVGFYLFKLVRDMALGNTSFGSAESTDFLTEFQKLRDEGKVNNEEYKRLKQSIPNVRSDDKDSALGKDSARNEQVEFFTDLKRDDEPNDG